jgi:probable HAF family extracellular repeat protein
MKLRLLLAVLVQVVLASAAHAAILLFQLTDLGTLGGAESHATAVNNNGQVVGKAMTPYGVYRAFAYVNGVMYDLGTLGGDYSAATGINDLAQITGESTLANKETRAFSFANGVMYDLGTLGGNYSTAAGINNNGLIVGTAALSSGHDHAFVFANAVMYDLGTLGGNYSTAAAIDDGNVIVGTSAIATNPLPGEYNQYAFAFLNGSMQNLSILGGIFNDPYHPLTIQAVSEGGIAGDYGPDPLGGFGPAGFAYVGGQLAIFGNSSTSTGSEEGVDAFGDVVGWYNDLGSITSSEQYASLYQDGVLYDLNQAVNLSTSNFSRLLDASATSSRTGYIVGTGMTKSGALHAYLLTPLPLP